MAAAAAGLPQNGLVAPEVAPRGGELVRRGRASGGFPRTKSRRRRQRRRTAIRRKVERPEAGVDEKVDSVSSTLAAINLARPLKSVVSFVPW